MKTWRLTASTDGNLVDFEALIECENEPDFWTCDQMATENGCEFWTVDELTDVGGGVLVCKA